MDTMVQNVGWRTVLLVQFQPQYVGIILAGTFYLVYVALKEFTEIVSDTSIKAIQNEFFISFEIIYFIDLVTMTIYRLSDWVEAKQIFPARKPLFIVTEFLIWLWFPISQIYHKNTKKKDLTYYGMRLTCVLRVIRIALYFLRIRSQVGNPLFWSITKEFFALQIFYLITVNLVMVIFMVQEGFKIFGFPDVLYHTISVITGKGTPMREQTPYNAMVPILLFTFISYMMYIFYVGSFIAALNYNMRDYFSFVKNLERVMQILQKWKYQSLHMQETIKSFYIETWHRRQCLARVDTFEYIIPEIMSKEIKLDICWDFFKHSHIFRDMETHYLRYLSKRAKITFFTPGELIYKKGRFKSKMIYIMSGVIQLLSEEDGETPIMSFSAGTCLGETTLFIDNISTCTVVCKNYSEVCILERKDFFMSYYMYPDEFKFLLRRIFRRFKDAHLYFNICKYQISRSFGDTNRHLLTMKWIKKTLHNMLNLKDKTKHITTVKLDDRAYENSFNEIVFCSEYLDMLVIANQYQLNSDKVILKYTLPMIFQPNSCILVMWDLFVGFLALILAFTYILYICFTEQSMNLYTLFLYFITIVWAIDIIIQGSTALVTRDAVITDIPKIITHCFSKPLFFIDIMACIPLEILVNILVANLSTLHYELIKANRVVKCYRLLTLFDMNKVSSSNLIVTLKYLKLITFALLLVTNLAGIMYITSCVNNQCGQYFSEFLIKRLIPVRDKFKILVACHYLSVQFIGGLVWGEYPLDRANYYIIVQLVYYYMDMYILADVAAAESLRNKNKLKYHDFVSNVNIIMKQWNFSKEFTKRVQKYCFVQWEYDNASYLLYQEKLFANVPFDLFKIEQHVNYARIVSHLPIFQNLPDDVLAMLCVCIERSVMPPGEVITYSGEVCKDMYVIETGFCEMIAQSRTTAKILGPGDSFSVIESCLNVSTINTVITLTDCKILSLSNENYLKTMRHFPVISSEINKILKKIDFVSFEQLLNKDTLDIESYTPEPLSYHKFEHHVDKNSKEYFEYYTPFFRSTGGTIFRYFLLRVTFTPYGNLIKYWEWARCIFAILTCLLNPVIIISSRNVYYGINTVLWILDISAWVDIYVRHHICYFNQHGIEVSHPLHTAQYYWKHGFLIDILSVMPFELIIPKVPGIKNRVRIQSYCRILRLFQAVRVYNMFHFHEYTTGKKLYVFFKYFLMVIFFQNICSFFVINNKCEFDNYDYEDKVFTGGVMCDQDSWITLNNSFLRPITPLRVYSYGIYFIAAITTFKGMEGFNVTQYSEIYENVIIVLIWFCLFPYFNAKLIASIMHRSVALVVYQNAMRTLVIFMKFRKIDPVLKNEVIDHFEYIWHKKQGRNESELFKAFNIALHEDALYHIYGTVMQGSSVFDGASKSFFKSLLLNVKHEIILKRGIISKVNDVHDKIFFLFKGQVDILGPDYKKLMVLPIGSVFGQLDYIKRSRQTLSYIAKGHVELLLINSNSFHSILAKYRNLRTQFKALTSINVDYLCNHNEVVIPDYITKNIDFVVEKDVKLKLVKKDIHDKKKCKRWRNCCKSCMYTLCCWNCCKWFKYFVRIRKRGTVMKCWEAIVLGVVCFIGPIIEFYHNSTCDHSTIILVMLYLTDFLFVIKIFLQFHTSYEDERGSIVTNRKLIAKRYLKRPFGFRLDITSTIPLELFSFLLINSDHYYSVFSYCRVFRLLRIILVIEFFHKVNQKLNINVLLMRLIYLMVMVILMLQFLVFLLFIVARYDKTLELFNACIWENYKIFGYLVQIKVILRMFTGSQIEGFKPNSPIVILMTALMMVFSRFVIAIFIAETCATLETVLHNKIVYETRVAALKKCLNRAGLSGPLQSRVLLYVKLLWLHHKGEQFPSLLSEVPYYLREGVLNSMFGFHLRSHPVLKKCHTDLIRQMTSFMTTRIFFPNDFITFVGDIDGYMYFIHEGEVCALGEDLLHGETVEKVFKAGQMFGIKQGLYEKCGHRNTYRANSYCILIMLQREKWIHLLDFYPASKYLIFDKNFQDTIMKEHDIRSKSLFKLQPQLATPTRKAKKRIVKKRIQKPF